MDRNDNAAGGPPGLVTDAAPPRIVGPVLAPGAVIADRYRLEARLGAGGGGTVWRCHDQKLDAIVALKIVSSDGDLERWRREVAMARRIADRNVCRVHDLGETADVRFVTMELIEGASLRTCVRPDLPAEQARTLFAQVTSGAAAIHAAGIVHRDLKPENVVVAHDGRAVIVDFGLAREPRPPGGAAAPAAPAGPGTPPAGEPPRLPHDFGEGSTLDMRGSAPAPPNRSPVATVTNVGVVVGTPRYMSPEQAAGETVDARTDVWALGLIGHELLAGHLPEPDERGRRIESPGSAGARSNAKRCGESIDPAVDAKLPGAAAILRRCLAFLPDQRFADARELAAALAGIERRRGSRRVAIGIAVAAAAAVGGAVATTVVLGGEDAQAPGAPTAERGGDRRGGDRGARKPAAPAAEGPVQVRTVVELGRWPEESPMSVAVHPDGQQFAYTRVGSIQNELLVGRVDGKTRPVEWRVPRLWRPGDRHEKSLVNVFAQGWFSDSSVALVGSTSGDGFALFRVYADGTSKLLHHQNPRFSVSVSRTDRVAFAVNDDAIFTLAGTGDGIPQQLVALGRGEQVLALAWSPDGTQLAVARMPASATAPAKIQIISDAGDSTYDVWNGPTAGIYDTALVWLDDQRIAFTQQDPRTREVSMYTLDIDDPARLRKRVSWIDEHVGIGSAANGTVLVTRGTAYHSVQVGDDRARDLTPVQAGLRGSYLSGWTSDGRVVFAAGTPGKLRVARARPGRDLEYWPGTQEGVEIPHTVVGDSVIVHRVDPAAPKDRQLVIERIGPRGERAELARIHSDASVTPIRCAGDRAGPCVISELSGNQVIFRELDPERGKLGEIVVQRPIGERYMCDLALSADGKQLAIVEGRNELTLYDRETGASKSWPATADAALQSVGFSASGDLWASSIGFEGRMFGLMVFPRDDRGGVKKLPRSRMRGSDGLRWYWRPSPSPDGKQIAATVREFRLHLAQIVGL